MNKLNIIIKRIQIWIHDTNDAVNGKFGPAPRGQSLDYWRGRRSALYEVLASCQMENDLIKEPEIQLTNKDWLREQCNHYTNGTCTTLPCVRRGSLQNPTCPAKEILESLQRLDKIESIYQNS